MARGEIDMTVNEQADYDDGYPPGPSDDDGCVSCGAEVDHYLGCSDDPRPDYQAEAAVADA